MDAEKQTFGATIEHPSTPTPATLKTEQFPALHLQPSRDTGHSSSPGLHSSVSTPSRDPSNPFSAFYEHRPSTGHSNTLKTPKVYNHDVESQTQFSQLSQTKSSMEPNKECSMWPSQATLKEQKRREKKKTSWSPLRGLNKKQKLVAQIIIALVVIGAAVGIGVGVSKAVGGGVWSSNGQSKQIPGKTPDKTT